jgi:hypothetical protein
MLVECTIRRGESNKITQDDARNSKIRVMLQIAIEVRQVLYGEVVPPESHHRSDRDSSSSEVLAGNTNLHIDVTNDWCNDTVCLHSPEALVGHFLLQDISASLHSPGKAKHLSCPCYFICTTWPTH